MYTIAITPTGDLVLTLMETLTPGSTVITQNVSKEAAIGIFNSIQRYANERVANARRATQESCQRW